MGSAAVVPVTSRSARSTSSQRTSTRWPMPLSDASAAGVRGQSQAMRDGEDCARDPGLRGCRAGTFDDTRHLRARAHTRRFGGVGAHEQCKSAASIRVGESHEDRRRFVQTSQKATATDRNGRPIASTGVRDARPVDARLVLSVSPRCASRRPVSAPCDAVARLRSFQVLRPRALHPFRV